MKEIKAEIHWIDEGVMRITCPYCGDKHLKIYDRPVDAIPPCKCGKKFMMQPTVTVYEVE